MWFTANATGYGLKGEHYRQIIGLLQPGDLFLRRFEGYIDKWFIPGWWNHAAIYAGDNQVVHAISDGVVKEDILNFMRTDHMIVLRMKDKSPEYYTEVVSKANRIVGKPYDFNFDFDNTTRFSCTELATFCLKLDLNVKRRASALWKKVVVADDFLKSDKLAIIWDSTKMV